jgi:ATP-dependent phosphofructokinase / diphosphate-dependent phosphofructokinase
MKDPATGRPRVRLVNVDSDRYAIARGFMLRLKHEDFSRPDELERFAKVTGLTPEQFRARFFYLVEHERELAVDMGLALAARPRPGGPTEGAEKRDGGPPIS